jgi:lysophospholipase L1-like esterase
MQTLPSVPRTFSAPRFEQPPKSIAMGDSLVYGYGDPVGGGWVERLRRVWMEQDGPVLYNLGVRGDRVSQVSERLEGEFRQRGELRNRTPDCLILSVGINDSPRLGRPDGRNFTEFSQFNRQIEELLDQARALCPVLFVGMAPVNEARMPFLDCFYFNHEDQYRYKEATRRACESRRIPYLDIFELWQSRGADWIGQHLKEDGLHPNVAGYKSLGEEVWNWLALHQTIQALGTVCYRHN